MRCLVAAVARVLVVFGATRIASAALILGLSGAALGDLDISNAGRYGMLVGMAARSKASARDGFAPPINRADRPWRRHFEVASSTAANETDIVFRAKQFAAATPQRATTSDQASTSEGLRAIDVRVDRRSCCSFRIRGLSADR